MCVKAVEGVISSSVKPAVCLTLFWGQFLLGLTPNFNYAFLRAWCFNQPLKCHYQEQYINLSAGINALLGCFGHMEQFIKRVYKPLKDTESGNALD